MTTVQVPSPLPTTRPLRLPASVTRVGRKRRTSVARSASASLIGSQIKALRMAAGVSAGALALSAKVSRSMLSRIENGLVSPSVATLDRIAYGLRVPLSRFFGDQRRRTDFCHVQAGRGLVVDRVGAVAGYRYELIGHSLSGNVFVEPYRVTLLAEAEPYVTFQHPGLKLLYFLSGKVRYRYGEKPVTVEAGDSLVFDATALHGIEAIEVRPVSYLSVVSTLRD